MIITMRLINTDTTGKDELRRLFENRLAPASDAAEATVREILERVRLEGDAALREYTRRWDYPQAEALRVPEEAIEAAARRVQTTPLWGVMERAGARIRYFHERQRQNTWLDNSKKGEILGQLIRPLARVGIYIPGGTAAYPSTVLMTAIPASVAGVGAVALSTPPNRETGLPPDGTLAACYMAGVQEVYAIGGAQAIGALAFGTESIPAVDKIVGPGNLYVNLAKRLVFGTVGIDSLAGPSEVAVLADEEANPATIAADILTQCEHDVNNSALLATPSESLRAAVLAEIERQNSTLPRAEFARKALEKNGFAVRTHSLEEAAEIVSLYAPEHVHIDVKDPWAILDRVTHAGAILIGPHSSAPLGDYMAGPSHTLPTAGGARFASPLSVDDFMKKSSLLYFGADTAAILAADAATFAEYEGLEGHARAARREF